VTHERLRSVAWLGALIVFKVAFLRSMYARGFLSVSADEFSRANRAIEWAAHPTFAWTDFMQTWLPPEKILNGSLLMVWPDPIWAPRLTAFVGSCVLLIAFYRLVRLLFEPWAVAALASALLVVQPWYAWSSGTPMLESYYLPLLFLGLVFLVEWLRDDTSGRWLAAALCFLGATGFHVQSWLLVNLVLALTLGSFVEALRRRAWPRVLRLAGVYVISDAFMLAVVIGEFVARGTTFHLIEAHSHYSRWFLGGYSVPITEKLLYYPDLLVSWTPWSAWVLLVLGVALAARAAQRRWMLAPAILGVVSLAAYSVFNVSSAPPTAAPQRYTLLWTMLALPYVAYGAYRLCADTRGARTRLVRGAVVAVAALLVGLLVSGNVAVVMRIPEGLPWSAVVAGQRLRDLMDAPGADPSHRYLVEVRYWDFLAVEAGAAHPGRVAYDRERDRERRDASSLFREESESVRAHLADLGVEWVALTSPALIARVDAWPWLTRVDQVDEWTLYRLRPTSEPQN
jgi:hypothetical protein